MFVINNHVLYIYYHVSIIYIIIIIIYIYISTYGYDNHQPTDQPLRGSCAVTVLGLLTSRGSCDRCDRKLRSRPVRNWSGKPKNLREYGYGSIPINTIFRGMNIHLPAILMFTRGTRFWHTAIWYIFLGLCVESSEKSKNKVTSYQNISKHIWCDIIYIIYCLCPKHLFKHTQRIPKMSHWKHFQWRHVFFGSWSPLHSPQLVVKNGVLSKCRTL